MKKNWLITAAMCAALSTNAWANSNPTPATPPSAPPPAMNAPAGSAPPMTSAAPSAAPMDPAPIAPAATAPTAPAASAPAETSTPAPDTSETTTSKKHHKYTLEAARKKAHEKADKLDKMTEEEWNQSQETKREHREKWKQMTPEEKAAYKKAHPWHHKASTDNSSAPATTAPATSQ